MTLAENDEPVDEMDVKVEKVVIDDE